MNEFLKSISDNWGASIFIATFLIIVVSVMFEPYKKDNNE